MRPQWRRPRKLRRLESAAHGATPVSRESLPPARSRPGSLLRFSFPAGHFVRSLIVEALQTHLCARPDDEGEPQQSRADFQALVERSAAGVALSAMRRMSVDAASAAGAAARAVAGDAAGNAARDASRLVRERPCLSLSGKLICVAARRAPSRSLTTRWRHCDNLFVGRRLTLRHLGDRRRRWQDSLYLLRPPRQV